MVVVKRRVSQASVRRALLQLTETMLYKPDKGCAKQPLVLETRDIICWVKIVITNTMW